MEFASGGNLGKKIRLSKDWKEGQILKISLDICSGIKHLHDNEIIHRNLKTDNILSDGDSWKISDYGHSEFLELLDSFMTES